MRWGCGQRDEGIEEVFKGTDVAGGNSYRLSGNELRASVCTGCKSESVGFGEA